MVVFLLMQIPSHACEQFRVTDLSVSGGNSPSMMFLDVCMPESHPEWVKDFDTAIHNHVAHKHKLGH